MWVIALGGAGVACGGDAKDAGPVTSMNSFMSVCSSMPVGVDDAAPFEGAAPHAIVGFTTTDGVERVFATQSRDDTGRTALRARIETKTPYPDALLPEPADVQLVACIDRAAVGEELQTCQFSNSPAGGVQVPTSFVPLHRTEWQATVYDARTRTEVAKSEPIVGAVGCPIGIEAGTEQLYTELDLDQQIDLLAGFVE